MNMYQTSVIVMWACASVTCYIVYYGSLKCVYFVYCNFNSCHLRPLFLRKALLTIDLWYSLNNSQRNIRLDTNVEMM